MHKLPLILLLPLFRFLNTNIVQAKTESPTKFFLEDGSDRQIEFILDKEGKVIKIWLYRAGVKTERIKIT
jgi:hypothetical protein